MPMLMPWGPKLMLCCLGNECGYSRTEVGGRGGGSRVCRAPLDIREARVQISLHRGVLRILLDQLHPLRFERLLSSCHLRATSHTHVARTHVAQTALLLTAKRQSKRHTRHGTAVARHALTETAEWVHV